MFKLYFGHMWKISEEPGVKQGLRAKLPEGIQEECTQLQA